MPKVVDHDARREAILEGCLRLFADRGYADVGMREVARELGVSTGTLYHYFEGKDDLFAQLFAWVAARDVARATADLAPQAAPSERLDRLARFVVDQHEDLLRVLLLATDFHRHGGDPAVLAAAASTYRAAIAAQAGLDDALAGPALSLMLGQIVHRLLDPGAVDADAHRAALERVAHAGRAGAGRSAT